jgi:hypothetical protein
MADTNSGKDVTRRDLGKAAVAGAALGLGAFSTAAAAPATDAPAKGPIVQLDPAKLIKEPTYCGLNCNLCAQRTKVSRQAADLRETMHKEGYDGWGRQMPDFPEFWRFLTRITDPDKCCPGCHAGGGFPGCGIRKCAKSKGVSTCPLCAEYPCKQIHDFAKVYPCVIADGERLKAIGVEKWMAEGNDKARTGFTYADIRIESTDAAGG